MAAMKGEPKLAHGELVYEYIIKHYITNWFLSKMVNSHFYDKAMKELELLKSKKRVKNNTKQEDNTAEKIEVPALGKPDKSIKQSASAKQPINQSRGKMSSSTLEETKVVLEDLMTENKKLQQKTDKFRDRIAHATVEIQEKDANIQRLTRTLENTRAERDELILRKPTGNKKEDQNTPIEELSDRNRPTELGKRFTEIYDNEWPDAFDNLTALDDKEKVRILFEIMKNTFTYCEVKFNQQEQDILNVLLYKSAQIGRSDTHPQGADGLKALRRHFSQETAKNLAKEYSSSVLKYYLQGFGVTKYDGTLVTYSERCVELCWLMMVCDRPMAISGSDEGKPYSLTLYKPYTRSVKDLKIPVVEMNVWPALYLHLNGPLVAKGIAQPKEHQK